MMDKILCPNGCGRMVDPGDIQIGIIVVGLKDDDPDKPTHGGSGCQFCSTKRSIGHYDEFVITGYTACPVCKGSGHITVRNGIEFDCWRCYGRRMIPIFTKRPPRKVLGRVDLGPDMEGELRQQRRQEEFDYEMDQWPQYHDLDDRTVDR